MKVKCPECGAAANIQDEKVPLKGAYAKCPKCGARMFIKKGGPPPEKGDTPMDEFEQSESDPSAPPKSQVFRPTSGKPSEAPPPPPKLPPHLRQQAEEGQEEEKYWDPDWEPPVTLGVEHTAIRGTKFGRTIIIILAFLIVGVIGYSVLIRPDTETMSDLDTQPPSNTEEVTSYPAYKISQDLRQLRWKIVRGNYTNFRVSRYGAEFRVLQEMLDECDAGCEFIYEADINPLKTQDGFEGIAYCGGGLIFKVKYHWTDESVFIDGAKCR